MYSNHGVVGWGMGGVVGYIGLRAGVEGGEGQYPERQSPRPMPMHAVGPDRIHGAPKWGRQNCLAQGAPCRRPKGDGY